MWMTWPVGSMKECAGTPTCVQTVTGAQIWARPSVFPSPAGSPGWAAGRSRTPGEEGSGEVEPGAAGGDSAASCSVVLAPDGRWHMWLQEQSILWKSWFPFSAAVGPQSVPEPPWSCMSSCGRRGWQRGLCRGLPELIGGGGRRTPAAGQCPAIFKCSRTNAEDQAVGWPEGAGQGSSVQSRRSSTPAAHAEGNGHLHPQDHASSPQNSSGV